MQLGSCIVLVYLILISDARYHEPKNVRNTVGHGAPGPPSGRPCHHYVAPASPAVATALCSDPLLRNTTPRQWNRDREKDGTLYFVHGSMHHNIFYEITNRCSYMQSILFHC